MSATDDPDRSEPVLWWLGGDDPAALLKRLDDLVAGDHLDRSVVDAESSGLRLGIVDPRDRTLRLARRLVRDGEPWHGRSDIWYSPDPSRRVGEGRLAFVFPGVEPGFATSSLALDELAHLAGLDPGLVPRPRDDAPVDASLVHHSAAVFLLGLFLHRVLRCCGVEPDVIAGHSLGEWSGTVASGIVAEDHADQLLGGLDLAGVELPDVDFVALSAGADVVMAALSAGDDVPDVVLSHDNSPHQSIICGPPAEAEKARQVLRAAGILGYRLEIRSGFHTPYAAPLCDTVGTHLDTLELRPARVPLWSATTIAPYPAGAGEIRDLYLRHLVEPVRFRPLVERLYDDAGVRVFLQLGLGSLGGFVDDTLRGRDHLAVPVVTTKRTAFAQVQRTLTALWAAGRNVTPLGQPEAVGTGRATASGHGPAPSAAAPSVPAPVAVAQATTSTPAPAVTAPSIPADRVARLRMAADVLALAAHSSHDILTALTTRLVPTPPAQAVTAKPSGSVTHPPEHSGGEAVAAQGGRVGSGGGWASSTTSRSQNEGVAAPPPGPAGPTVPAWPTSKVTVRRRLSLETMPETLDHRLFALPERWSDPTDGFPIVAMTTQLQLLQDVVEEQVGRPVVEIAGVRNVRWLDLSDPQDVDIALTPKGSDTLNVALGSWCRADLRVGEPGEPPRHQPRPLTGSRPTQVTAEELFARRIMFHGPRFQGITQLGPVGDDGIVARFHNLDTPGSLLDNLGKLVAYWVIEQRGPGESPLPIAVESIELFGPVPPDGERLDCDVRILELQDSLVRADGVIVRPDGSLWCRVHGWTSHIFHLDAVTEPLYRNTLHSVVAEPQPGGWFLTLERWPTGAGRDLTARRFLARHEAATYETLNLLERRRWLIEIAAVKDTVRRWLDDRFGIGSYPVELTAVPDDAAGPGRYRVTGDVVPAGCDPRVTVVTVPWAAATVVDDARYRDIEAVLIEEDDDPDSVAAHVAQNLQASNPDTTVSSTTEVHAIPSTIEIVVAPNLATAWT